MFLSTTLMRNESRHLLQALKVGSSAMTGSTTTVARSSITMLSPRNQMPPVLCSPKFCDVLLKRFSTSSKTLSSSASDHVKMWSAERVVAILNIPAVVLPFLYTNPLTDAFFCTILVVHFHWGVEAIVVDYIRPVLFGGNTLIPKMAVGAVWLVSAFTLGALYYFNYTDVGIVNAIKMIWKL